MPNPVNTSIYGAYAREILDSRGNPTIETTVVLESGYRATIAIPSGASVGISEAFELRDKDEKRYNGKGVLKAVSNVNSIISPAIKGKDAAKQADIDRLMIDLDGTPTKKNLGANAILSVSMGAALAVSQAYRTPLYVYLNSLFSTSIPTAITKIPTPIFNMINGGKHGAGNLDFQEFWMIPASNKPYTTALEMGVILRTAISQILTQKNLARSIGDEGGFAPNLFTNMEVFDILLEAVRVSPYQFGIDIFFGLDLAASEFYSDKGYTIKDRPHAFSTKEFIEYLKILHDKYHLLLLEDPLAQNDWSGWKLLNGSMGEDTLLIGDDLLTTNYTLLSKAIENQSCDGIMLKPNQIGTLSEFFGVVKLAKEKNIKCVVGHRSGETNDSFIADLAVAIQSDYVKFGSPNRGERIAKYNRLLAIDSEIRSSQRT